MIILVTGLKQSGKSTFCNILEQEYGFKSFMFAERLKEMATKIIPMIFHDLHMYKGVLYNKANQHEQTEIDWESEEFKSMVIPSIFNKEQISFREFLQKFGTDFIRQHINNDYWKEDLYYKIDNYPVDDIDSCVSDMRFFNEHRDDTIVVGIDRGYKLKGGDHLSELEIPRIIKNLAKFTIDSNCPLKDYEDRCRKLIRNNILPLLKESNNE